MQVVYGEYATMGDISDPKEHESIWAWNDRTKNYYPNKCNVTDMMTLWSGAMMRPNTMNVIRDTDEWQSMQNENEHIMAWGDFVFFSDDGELALFKLQFYEQIEVVRIQTRRTFKYVNR